MIRGLAQRVGFFFALLGLALIFVFFTADVGGGATGFDLLLAGIPLILIGTWLMRSGQRRRRARRFRMLRRLFGSSADEHDDHPL